MAPPVEQTGYVWRRTQLTVSRRTWVPPPQNWTDWLLNMSWEGHGWLCLKEDMDTPQSWTVGQTDYVSRRIWLCLKGDMGTPPPRVGQTDYWLCLKEDMAMSQEGHGYPPPKLDRLTTDYVSRRTAMSQGHGNPPALRKWWWKRTPLKWWWKRTPLEVVVEEDHPGSGSGRGPPRQGPDQLRSTAGQAGGMP